MKWLLPAVIAVTLAAVSLTAPAMPPDLQKRNGPQNKQENEGRSNNADTGKGKRQENEAVARAIAYGESVIGARYVWWTDGPLPKQAPMWTANGPPPDPDVVRKQGTNCAGLTNLMLRAVGKRVPRAKGHGQGGTAAYAAYYDDVAKKFDVKRKYPAGTLIGRNYRDVNSQGHVAVVLADGHVLQAIPDEGVNKTYTVRQSNGKGYYEYAVLPEDWLGKSGE